MQSNPFPEFNWERAVPWIDENYHSDLRLCQNVSQWLSENPWIDVQTSNPTSSASLFWRILLITGLIYRDICLALTTMSPTDDVPSIYSKSALSSMELKYEYSGVIMRIYADLISYKSKGKSAAQDSGSFMIHD